MTKTRGAVEGSRSDGVRRARALASVGVPALVAVAAAAVPARAQSAGQAQPSGVDGSASLSAGGAARASASEASASEASSVPGPRDQGATAGEPAGDGSAREAGVLEGGFRAGIGIPLGSAARGKEGGTDARDLGDLTPYRTPLWVDLSYRLSDAASLGAYVQVGFGGSGDACNGSCTWADVRLGIQGSYQLDPGGDFDPWLGVGIGYESLTYRSLRFVNFEDPETGEPVDQLRLSERLGGPELLLQGGLDFELEPALRVGPYLAGTLGLFTRDGIKCSDPRAGCTDDTGVDGSSFHSWITIGVRGAYNP